MRLVGLLVLASGFCACAGHGAVDPLDAPIELAAGDTGQVDLKAIGLVGMGSKPPFVWSCGSFRYTHEERVALDSTAAAIRGLAGQLCY
jgi:hypothetical protein